MKKISNCPANRERGYILPEALLAVMILMTALTALAGMYLGALQNAAGSLNRTAAVFLAQAKMEELKAAWHLSGDLADESASDSQQLNGVTFHRQFAAQNYVVNSLDLVRVTVVVTWDGQGQSREISLVTYFNK